jgi:hypothetical protein
MYGDDAVPVTSAAHCVQCPPDSGQNSQQVDNRVFLQNSKDKCLCFPGFQKDGDRCAQCEAYKIKTGYSDTDVCAYCAEYYYFVNHISPCLQCELEQGLIKHHEVYNPDLVFSGAEWGRSEQDCRCSLGYRRSGHSCVACERGTFQSELSVTGCQDCGAGKYQWQTAQSSCENCGDTQISPVGSDEETDCQCPAGSQSNVDNPKQCDECEAGKLKASYEGVVCVDCAAGKYQDLTGASLCVDCTVVGALPDQSVADAPRDRKESCVCESPQAFQDGATGCTDCSVGSFRSFNEHVPEWFERNPNAGKPNKCESCPPGRTTLGTGKELETDCLAAAGQQPNPDQVSQGIKTRNNADCVPCEVGKYKYKISDDYCIACSATEGEGTTVSDGSVSFEQCQCDADNGYFTP